MTDRIAESLVKYRGVYCLLGLLLLVALAGGLNKLYMNTSYKVFYAEDNPNRMAREQIKATYGSNDNLMFVVAPKNGRVFTQENLAAIEYLTEQSWTLPHSLRVDSITNFQHTYAEGDDLIVQNLVDDALNMSAESIAAAKAAGLADQQLVNKMLADRGHVTAINVPLNMPEDSDENPTAESRAIADVVQAARELRTQTQEHYPQIEIFMLGNVVVNTTFTETARHDMKTLFPILFLVMVGLLIFMMRSVWSALITVVIIIFSVVSTQGAMGWSGMAINQVNSMSPIIILSLAVCDCVHLLSSYLGTLRMKADKKWAMTEALKINLQPIFITALTTAIGFLALNTSDVPPFAQLGTISAIGVMMAFIFTVLVVPTLGILLPFKAKPLANDGNNTVSGAAHSDNVNQSMWTAKLADTVIKQQKPLFGFGLVTLLFVSSLAFLNELNDNVLKYFDDDLPLPTAAYFVEDNLTGFHEIQYSLDSGSSGGVNDPEFLKKVEAFSDWYMTLPETVHVTSYIDVVKRLNKNMHGDDPAWYRIPDNRELASQYQLLYELSLPYGLGLENQVDMDKRTLLLKATLKDVTSKEIVAIDRKAQDWLLENTPAMHTRGAGIAIMFAHLGMENIVSMLSGSVVAVVLITLTLSLVLRSLKLGLMSLVPNVFPAAIVFGVWGVTNGVMNLGVAVIFSLTLGIVVDDTVHFLSKYIRAKRLHGYSSEQAVRYAFNSVGRALLITTLTLAAGFFMLSFSKFVVNANMGTMVAATIVVALLLDFLFLPTLLLKIDKLKSKSVEGKSADTSQIAIEEDSKVSSNPQRETASVSRVEEQETAI